MPNAMIDSLLGAAVIGIPAYVIAWVLLRKQARAIFLFAVVLLAFGVGYLSATGATSDIGRTVKGLAGLGASAPAPKPAQ